MKKLIKILLTIFMINNWQFLYSEAVSVIVPKQCLVEQASLVLYMLDDCGQQSIGTCRLHQDFEKRNILPQDLHIQTQEIINQISNSIDVTNHSQPCDHEVVLHIEFDKEIKLVRVLVVKDNLLADDPFNVFSISVNGHSKTSSFDEEDLLGDLDDDLDTLLASVDTSKIKKNNNMKRNRLLTQYALYAKIFVMMQYKHAQHKMRDLASWWLKK